MISSQESHEHPDRDTDNLRYDASDEITPEFLAMLEELSRKVTVEPDVAEARLHLARHHGHPRVVAAFAITLMPDRCCRRNGPERDISGFVGLLVLGTNPYRTRERSDRLRSHPA